MERSPRYAKSHVTRARILAAARADASEHGLQRVSVARVAARAETAVGSLNYHFGSREALLDELMTDVMKDLVVRLAAAESPTRGDFFERLRAAHLAYLAYLRANHSHIRLADEIKLCAPALHAQGVAEWVADLEGRIRAGIDEGTLRPMTAPEISAHAHFLLGARHHLEAMIDSNNPALDERVVDWYVALVRDGLNAAGPR